jgi:hypothetical protein
MKPNVLIVGAGAVAHVAAHKAAQNNDVLGNVCIASRTKEKAEKIIESIKRKDNIKDKNAHIYPRQIDALDIPAMVKTLEAEWGGLVGGGSGFRVFVRWAGVIGATVALVVTLTAIWKDLHGNSEIYTILVTVAAFLAYLNIMLALPLQRRYDWLRFSTLAAAAVTAVCVDLAIIGKYSNPDWAERIGAAAGIVGGCGTLAIAVLLRMNRPIDVSPDGCEYLGIARHLASEGRWVASLKWHFFTGEPVKAAAAPVPARRGRRVRPRG